MNTTTQTFARTSRKSGTEYANAIEHHRRTDYSGQAIVFVFCAALMALTFFAAWKSI